MDTAMDTTSGWKSLRKGALGHPESSYKKRATRGKWDAGIPLELEGHKPV